MRYWIYIRLNAIMCLHHIDEAWRGNEITSSLARAKSRARGAIEIRPRKSAVARALWDLHGIDLSFNESARDAFAGGRMEWPWMAQTTIKYPF